MVDNFRPGILTELPESVKGDFFAMFYPDEVGAIAQATITAEQQKRFAQMAGLAVLGIVGIFLFTKMVPRGGPVGAKRKTRRKAKR